MSSIEKNWKLTFPQPTLNTKHWWSLFQMITNYFIAKFVFRSFAEENSNHWIKNSLHGSSTSLVDGMETQEDFSCSPLTVKSDSKSPQNKMTFALDSSKSPEKKYNGVYDTAFLTSIFTPPTLKPPPKLDLHRADSLSSQLSTEKFQFKSRKTSL